MSFDGRLRTTHAGQICCPRPAVYWVVVWLVLVSIACQAGMTPSPDPAESDPAPALSQVVSTSSPAPSVTLALLGDVMLRRAVRPSTETFSFLEPYLTSSDLAL